MTALDEVKIGGVGASRQAVEDARFIRGRGNYLDDIRLPGMLHMEILRSPLAHARIRSIDTSKAWEIPGVRLVLTGEMMAQRNLAWMPTLSYDTQAVLATDKVRFQGQEVCVVVADDPYTAKDGCEAIVVDYEPLPPVVNPEQALAPDAPLIRDDKEGQTDNVCYRWEVGDREGTERAFAEADVVSRLKLHYPRSHPSPIENCGSIADYNPATQKLTVYMTTQAPHIIRAAVALVAELPEHMIRIVSPDIGGGFGNKVPVYPGYVASILCSILLGKPVKWIEDKSGNLISTGFGRDMYLDSEMALRADGKILAVRFRADTDQGAFFSDAQPSKFKVGLLHSAFACYNVPFGHITAQGALHEQGAGRRRLPVLVPGHRGDVLPGAHDARRGHRPGDGPGRVPPDQPAARRPVPAPHGVRLPRRLRPVREVPAARPRRDRLPRTSRPSRPRPAPAADGSASESRR